MLRRLGLLLTAAVVVASACSSSTATPTPTTASQTTAPSAALPSASPTAAISNVDIVEHAYKPTPAGKTGGTVVLSDSQFPDLLNGYYTSSAESWEAIYPAFDGLWRVANDFKFYPDLTKDVPTTTNGGVVLTGSGMDVKVNLKDGMKWSDGQPITCDDLIATWKWIMDKNQAGLVAGYARLGRPHEHRWCGYRVVRDALREGLRGLSDPGRPAPPGALPQHFFRG